jgi:hypothetical protein
MSLSALVLSSHADVSVRSAVLLKRKLSLGMWSLDEIRLARLNDERNRNHQCDGSKLGR